MPVVFGVRWTPVRVPLHQRMEMFAVLVFTILVPLSLCCFTLMWLNPALWPLLWFYTVHIMLNRSYDDGRVFIQRSGYFRRLALFKHLCNYFPITLHRTHQLEPTFLPEQDPDRPISIFRRIKSIICGRSPFGDTRKLVDGKPRYLFGYHPHGIISVGAFGGIASDSAGWAELFPGIPVSLLTLESNFNIPIYRDILMGIGMASVSKRSCLALLRNGASICIVVGGAQESLLAHPGQLDLILNKRLGFVKVAMQAGNTSLVPILAFGENDIYDQVSNPPGTLLYKMQVLLKNILGFTLPLMHARGIFNYDAGVIPYRRPINLVVGKAIPVPYDANPTTERLKHYHELYANELRNIWNENKDKYFQLWSRYGSNHFSPPADLRFVE